MIFQNLSRLKLIMNYIIILLFHSLFSIFWEFLCLLNMQCLQISCLMIFFHCKIIIFCWKFYGKEMPDYLVNCKLVTYGTWTNFHRSHNILLLWRKLCWFNIIFVFDNHHKNGVCYYQFICMALIFLFKFTEIDS